MNLHGNRILAGECRCSAERKTPTSPPCRPGARSRITEAMTAGQTASRFYMPGKFSVKIPAGAPSPGGPFPETHGGRKCSGSTLKKVIIERANLPFTVERIFTMSWPIKRQGLFANTGSWMALNVQQIAFCWARSPRRGNKEENSEKRVKRVLQFQQP